MDAAAAAIDDVLAQRPAWLGEAVEALVGPDGTWLLAPLERWSSAMQGALMFREVPRRLAVGCETGEWSHVDVYLTLGRDYRALVFAGSPWDAQATEWLRRRQSTFWAIGGNLPGSGAHAALRVETTIRSSPCSPRSRWPSCLPPTCFAPRRSRSGEERLPGGMAIAQGGGDQRGA